jgi:hypothetical protein
MEKFVLQNPDDFGIESAVIAFDYTSREYVMDVYSSYGHKDFTGKNAAALKAKFTREYGIAAQPELKASWTVTQYTEQAPEIPEIDAEDDSDAEDVPPVKHSAVEWAMRNQMLAWIDALPDRSKVIDIGGTLYSFQQIKMELKNETMIGQAFMDVVFAMFLRYIRGEADAQQTIPRVVEEYDDKTDEIPELAEAEPVVTAGPGNEVPLFFGALTELKYQADGTVAVTIVTKPEYMELPHFDDGRLTTSINDIMPVRVMLQQEQI